VWGADLVEQTVDLPVRDLRSREGVLDAEAGTVHQRDSRNQIAVGQPASHDHTDQLWHIILAVPSPADRARTERPTSRGTDDQLGAVRSSDGHHPRLLLRELTLFPLLLQLALASVH
jgi:hypothetical protein